MSRRLNIKLFIELLREWLFADLGKRRHRALFLEFLSQLFNWSLSLHLPLLQRLGFWRLNFGFYFLSLQRSCVRQNFYGFFRCTLYFLHCFWHLLFYFFLYLLFLYFSFHALALCLFYGLYFQRCFLYLLLWLYFSFYFLCWNLRCFLLNRALRLSLFQSWFCLRIDGVA